MTEGQSPIPWDGRGEGGATLPDGPYTLTLASHDPSGNTTSAQTRITIDSTAPSASLISPSIITPSQSVGFQVADGESGLASFSVSLDGQVIGEYGGFGNSLPPNGQVGFSARTGWTLGMHRWEISAADNVGNRGTTSGTFTVVARVPVQSSSSGVKRCVVPHLVGQTLKASKRMLSAAHCRIGRVSYRLAGRRHKGRVI